MLTEFSAITGALAVVVLILVVAPMLRRGSSDAEHRESDKASLALLRQQFAELERQHAAGRIPEDEYQETRHELEVRVLDEARAGGAERGSVSRGTQLAVAAFVAVLLPLSGYLCWSQVGSPRALDESFLAEQAQSARQQSQSRGHSATELSRSVTELEERLKENPDNLDGWIMLSRTNAAMKNWRKADEAFEQINRLLPNNADVLADWADTKAAAQGGDLSGKPLELIEQALKVDPKHGKALMLRGTYCFNTRDFAGAVRYWERILPLVQQGSEEWKMIAESIEQARKAGGLAPSSSGMTLSAPPTVKGGGAPATVKEAKYFLEGTVDIAPELKEKLRPNDVVYIYARPMQGSKMPVAYDRVPARNFPIKFHLDDGNTMASGMMTLADVEQVVVEARVSHSGNFMSASGDLQGTAKDPVKAPARDVRVRIDTVLP